MGTLSTAAQKVAWDVNSTIQSLTSNAQSLFESVIGRAGAAAGAILQGDVVGINGAQVPAMQQAIREYVDKLNQHLQEVKTTADTTQAFKGEYAASVTAFVEAVCTACECVISNLLKFNQKLDEVYKAYQEKDTTMASDIKSQAGELEGSFQRYTE